MKYTGDKRLMRAAKALEWAVRWFFHMWATRDGSCRWESYSEWRRYLTTWTTRKAYGNGAFDERFIHGTITGINWLLGLWYGIELTPLEQWLLKKMFRQPRHQEKEEPLPEPEEAIRPWRYWHWTPYCKVGG